jgi:hypothetical protein
MKKTTSQMVFSFSDNNFPMVKETQSDYQKECNSAYPFQKDHTGAKYEISRDIKDIAKMVRADIKKAVKDGSLPKGTKVGVRISRFSMGQSLTAEIKSLGKIQTLDPEWIAYSAANPHDPFNAPDRYTEEATKYRETVEQIVASYNRDKSSSMVDYFDVNFYTHIEFGSELRNP